MMGVFSVLSTLYCTVTLQAGHKHGAGCGWMQASVRCVRVKLPFVCVAALYSSFQLPCFSRMVLCWTRQQTAHACLFHVSMVFGAG